LAAVAELSWLSGLYCGWNARGNAVSINNNWLDQSLIAARANAFGDGHDDTSTKQSGSMIAGSASLNQ
jgi:hypothetical protein